MPEYSEAVMRALLARITTQGNQAARTGLIGLADMVTRQAKTNASNGSHLYGTPTPARPGTGPARISGTLVNSITRTATTPSGAGWQVKVGLAPGRTPPYRKGRGATSSKYGLFLETGLRNGARYPFLGPAANLAPIQARVAFAKAFSAVKWPSV
jgi:hypothetical protein